MGFWVFLVHPIVVSVLLSASAFRANKRPKKKLHLMAQTDGHGDSMTNSALWGQVGENVIIFTKEQRL